MPTVSPLPRHSALQPGATWMDALLGAFPAPPDGSSRRANGPGFPGRWEEAWRFTDLALLTRIPPRPLDEAGENQPPLPAPGPHTWRLPLDTWSQGGRVDWPEGIEPLSGPDLAPLLGQVLAATGTEHQWLTHLNCALAYGVVALRIRPGVHTCLEVVTDTAQRSGVLPHRLLLVVEEGATLQLLQVHQASGPNLTSSVMEIRLEKQASLRHALVAHGDARSALMAGIAVSQAPGSHYAFTSVCSGWGLARQEPVIFQCEGQATTHLRGLHWVRGTQISDTHSRVTFAGPEGKLDQVHKVVAEEEGRSVFNGCIQVPRQGQRTDASQLSRSLLLSDRARIDTKPQLEIVADDVRCTHGATISRLQEDELFYLQSRGIGAPQASRLLLRSFCDEVMGQLPPAAQVWLPQASFFAEER